MKYVKGTLTVINGFWDKSYNYKLLNNILFFINYMYYLELWQNMKYVSVITKALTIKLKIEMVKVH